MPRHAGFVPHGVIPAVLFLAPAGASSAGGRAGFIARLFADDRGRLAATKSPWC